MKSRLFTRLNVSFRSRLSAFGSTYRFNNQNSGSVSVLNRGLSALLLFRGSQLELPSLWYSLLSSH